MCTHTHTDLRTRGWKPSGLQNQFNLAKAQREFSLPFCCPPPFIALSLFLLWWWQRRWLRSRGSDWLNYGTDELARRRQKSSVISHKTSQPLHYQPLMCSLHIHAGVIASDSRKGNGVTWLSYFTSLYLGTEHLRAANDWLRYHGLCNGGLNDSLKSADKDICYFSSGQTASSSCVSEFKVTSLMSCYDISPP